MLTFKSYFSQLSLHLKMLSVTFITIFVVLLLSFVLLISIDSVNQLNAIKKQLTITGKTISSNVHSAVVFGDADFAKKTISSLKIQENITLARLYTDKGLLFVQYQRDKNVENIPIEHYYPEEGIIRQGLSLIYIEKLYLDKSLIATLIIYYQLNQYLYQLMLEALYIILIFIISAYLSFIVWSKLESEITKPIFLLLDSIHKVTQKNDYSVKVPKQIDDELGQLIDGFNEMLLEIQKRDQLLEANTKQLEIRVAERTDELLQEKLNAETANRSKSEFLAMVSHEIRTPMNAILGFSYLTLRTKLNPRQKENLKNIHQSTQSLLSIINDILDFSKMDVGKLDIDIRVFNLKKIIDHSYKTMQLIAAQKGLKLTIDFPENIPDHIMGDSNRLQQVLVNLIGNAIKFTDKGSVNVVIACEQMDEKNLKLDFTVTDTGIGISEEDQQQLFQLFSQLDSSISRKFSGTGLGLAVSQKLVQLMGGNIGVKSTIGKGSSFCFALTFERCDNQSMTDPDIQSYNMAIPTELAGCRVLVVEDQYINQQVVKAILEQAGIVVTLASNGLDAIELIEQQNQIFDVILMDLQMPEMSGYETTRYIRDQLKQEDIPIITMTANVLAADKQQLAKAGMNDYISKPIIPDQLYAIILKWANKYQLNSEPANNTKRIINKSSESRSYSDDKLNPINLLSEKLQGINTQLGLKYAGGNENLYLRLLLSFYREKNQSINEFHQAKKNNDFQACQNISHNLKGLAGTLGAERLFDQSQKIIQMCKNKEFNQAEFSLFEQSFNEVMRSLEALEKKQNSDLSAIITTDKLQDNLKITDILQDLELSLKAGNYDVVSYLDQLSFVIDDKYKTSFHVLEQQIMSFNFNAALKTLDDIQLIVHEE